MRFIEKDYIDQTKHFIHFSTNDIMIVLPTTEILSLH